MHRKFSLQVSIWRTVDKCIHQGFGFIAMDGGEDHFVHAANLLEGNALAVGARVTFAPDVGWEAVARAIDSGECKGSSARLGRFVRANPGLLRVYLDDMDAPVLSAPIEMSTVFRDGADGAERKNERPNAPHDDPCGICSTFYRSLWGNRSHNRSPHNI